MIPALDRVGKGFEKGTVFPSLTFDECGSGKAALEVIKGAAGEDQAGKEEKKGRSFWRQ